MRKQWKWVVLFVFLAVLAGCSRKYYEESADREVASIIAAKSEVVPNMETNFTIAASAKIPLDDLPEKSTTEEMFGENGDFEKGARIWT